MHISIIFVNLHLFQLFNARIHVEKNFLYYNNYYSNIESKKLDHFKFFAQIQYLIYLLFKCNNYMLQSDMMI